MQKKKKQYRRFRCFGLPRVAVPVIPVLSESVPRARRLHAENRLIMIFYLSNPISEMATLAFRPSALPLKYKQTQIEYRRIVRENSRTIDQHASSRTPHVSEIAVQSGGFNRHLSSVRSLRAWFVGGGGGGQNGRGGGRVQSGKAAPRDNQQSFDKFIARIKSRHGFIPASKGRPCRRERDRDGQRAGPTGSSRV